jgi:hypothetical protein
MTFLSQYEPGAQKDILFLQNRPEAYKLRMVCAFVHYLYTDCRLSSTTVTQVLSGVRHGVRTALQDLAIFANPAVAACKQSIRKLDKLKGIGMERRKLPFTLDMVYNALQHLPTNSITNHMLRTAIQLAFFGLFRSSEIVPNAKNPIECHALRFADVNFILANGQCVDMCSISTTHMFDSINTVRITLQSAKNDQMRIGHNIWFDAHSVAPPGAFAINIARVLYDWALLVQPTMPQEKLMSFVSKGKTYRLLYDPLRNTIKACAKRMGFDASLFSVHSLRIGGASTLRAGGASDSMIQLLGRWASYRSAMGYMSGSLGEFVRMQHILADPRHLTSDVVRLLDVRPSGRVPSDNEASELDLTSEAR